LTSEISFSKPAASASRRSTSARSQRKKERTLAALLR
jgi:hypothetical protein